MLRTLRSRVRYILPVLLILAAAGAAYWWWQGRDSAESGVGTVSGTIEATEVTIAAEGSGRVTSVYADAGDAVRAG